MKKTLYTVGAVALAFAMSGAPAVVLAEKNSDEGSARAQVSAPAQGTGAAVRGDEEGGGQGQNMQVQDVQTDGPKLDEKKGGEKMEGSDQDKQELDLELEDDADVASSFDDLEQKIEVRKHELDVEEASTTPELRDVVKNANEVRLAVHSLLASKELLGGIGSQVSEIAKDMNDSVATTTNVEAKIQSRGFLTRLFFGGDSAAADVISQEVARNQQHIDDLTKLLEGANVPADIQAVLKAQITAIQDAQTRLLDLAQKEQKQWGLFSWRF
ncbi:MAG: hypothetical protein NT108_00290 [Candidatus Kaiserbacteria bacterium]|nr:hypothetical protein [Candidatus Kaiserbacteria bacterium]